MELEKRLLEDETEYRAYQEEERYFIEGYALKFGKRSNPIMGQFVEVIDSRALDNTDMSDVLGRINHGSDMANVFARSGVNLDLVVDEVGLRYKAELDPESQRDMQLYRDMNRGLIKKSSFAFKLREEGGDKWEDRDGEILRTLLDIEVIGDVAPVHKPAYDDTSVQVSQRSLESKEQFEKELEAKSKKELEESRKIKRPLDIDDKARFLLLKNRS